MMETDRETIIKNVVLFREVWISRNLVRLKGSELTMLIDPSTDEIYDLFANSVLDEVLQTYTFRLISPFGHLENITQ